MLSDTVSPVLHCRWLMRTLWLILSSTFFSLSEMLKKERVTEGRIFDKIAIQYHCSDVIGVSYKHMMW